MARVAGRLLPAFVFAVLLVLGGCGVSAPPAATLTTPAKTVVTGSTLGGNWLLFGTMPTYFPSATIVTPGLAVSFDVEDGKITAAASLQQACTSGAPFGWVFVNALSGTVAADGTFNVALNSGSQEKFSLQGKVPSSAGQAWTGSYGFTSDDATCPINLAGSFTATPVADLTGTFVGSGPLSNTNTAGAVVPSTAALTVNETFQQRGYLPTASSSASSVYSDQALSGSLQISGISCFSKG